MNTIKMWSTGGYRCEIVRDEPTYLVRLLGAEDAVLREQVTYSTDAASAVVLEWASEVIGVDTRPGGRPVLENVPFGELLTGERAS